MSQALIILGAFLALAGIGSIAAGAPSWILGLGLGTALIQSGATGLVGGFLLIGIGFVLRALRDLSNRIDMIAPATGVGQPVRPAAAPRAPAKRDAAPPLPTRREPPPFAGREEGRESALLERDGGEGFLEAEHRARPRPRFPEIRNESGAAFRAFRPGAPASRGGARARL